MISAFARDVVFASGMVDICVAGPDARNRRSLRAFEKAGFQAIRTVLDPGTGNRETLMVARRWS